jgi:DNA uptake protein ComE-like DNA-binding protein
LLAVGCGGPDSDWDEGLFFDDGKADGFSGTFEGVTFTNQEAVAVLDFANRAPRDVIDEQAGLGSRAAQSIVDARPIGTMARLAAVANVGPAALSKLKAYAPRWVSGNEPAQSCGLGGRFDGVAFTATEECRALDLMNTAGYLQLASIPGYARRVIYDRRPWKSLADLAATQGVGAEAMRALRVQASEWLPGRSGVLDTVAGLLRNPPPLEDGRPPQVTIDRGRLLSRVSGTVCVWLSDASQQTARIQLCPSERKPAIEALFTRAINERAVVRVRAAYRIRDNGGRYLQGSGTDFVQFVD